MSQSAQTFSSRVRRVEKRHNKMNANGMVPKMGKDGLVSAYPRRRLPRLPIMGILAVLACAFLYKATVFAWLGETVYDARVAALSEGTGVEKAGAWLMQSDPATEFLAGVIAPILPN